jgi:hypothetical protein
MPDPQNEGTMIILNVGKYLPIEMAEYPRNVVKHRCEDLTSCEM